MICVLLNTIPILMSRQKCNEISITSLIAKLYGENKENNDPTKYLCLTLKKRNKHR